MKGVEFNLLPIEKKVEAVLSGGKWIALRKEEEISYNLFRYNGFFVEIGLAEKQDHFVSVNIISGNIVLVMSTSDNFVKYKIL
jgi:hypothetical protein